MAHDPEDWDSVQVFIKIQKRLKKRFCFVHVEIFISVKNYCALGAFQVMTSLGCLSCIFCAYNRILVILWPQQGKVPHRDRFVCHQCFLWHHMYSVNIYSICCIHLSFSRQFIHQYLYLIVIIRLVSPCSTFVSMKDLNVKRSIFNFLCACSNIISKWYLGQWILFVTFLNRMGYTSIKKKIYILTIIV